MIGAVLGGLAVGGSILGNYLNYKNQSKTNEINQSYNEQNLELARRNANLQEDVAYNGLGIRIADAERNGISKWAVAGDGATAGNIGSASTSPIEANKIDAAQIADAVMHSVEAENMSAATSKLKQEQENLKYQLEYADKHKLPIGIQPGLEQSLLGWLDTPENRDYVAGLVKNAVNGISGKLGENPLETAEKKAKEFVRKQEDKKQKRDEKRGMDKVRKAEQKAKKKAMSKPAERRERAQSRNQGALPPGSIPNSIYRR